MIDSPVHAGTHLHTHHHSAPHSGQGQVASGLLQGQPVVQLDHASVLADAADELTQQFSTKVEEKTLRERRLGASGKTPVLTRSQIQALLQALHNGGQNDEQRSQDLMALGRRILRNPQHARQEVARQGGQASEQYLSLLELAELLQDGSLGADAGGRALDAVMDAAAELDTERGDAIWADINTVQAAQSHATQTQAPDAAQRFRQTYRDTVLGASDLNSTLKLVLESHKSRQGASFTQVLGDMVNALGMDLAAARPSRDPVRLQSLVSDLFQLGVVAAVIDTCDVLGQELQTQFDTPPLKASALTADLAGLSGERWVDATRFESLARQHQCDAPASCKVAFVAGIRQALKALPLQIFTSPDARQAILDAAQLALDRAIDLEAEEI
ncbi:MAG: TyeA family type III secretion system gatekeeper subunit [Pseudomonadota bacterium]